MKIRNARARWRRVQPFARATVLASVLAASIAPAHAHKIDVPSVPANLEVPADHVAFFVGHAVGTQNYVCLPAGESFKYTLITPQATLYNDDDKQLTTHFFSANPAEGGTIRAAWLHSRDTSTVWGRVVPGDLSSDPNYVDPDAIPWLKVTVVGAEEGPHGGDKLTKTTFILRLNTSGGLAPATGCSSASDVGRQAFVPYTTDYYFFRKR